MIKEGLPTRNRYITSLMGAAFAVPVIHRPLRDDGPRAVLLAGDRPSALDRGARCLSCDIVNGSREQTAA
jgi:hypothetical protein